MRQSPLQEYVFSLALCEFPHLENLDQFMTSSIETLLSSYPRRRPALDPYYQSILEGEYFLNRNAKSVATKLSVGLEGWLHRQVSTGASNQNVLEVGAGNLNHLAYENANAYDIIEPFSIAYEKSPRLSSVRHAFSDIDDVLNDLFYDRIISVAALEHITDLPYIIARCITHLTEDGVFQAGIPTEGGMLWHLAQACSTGISFRLRHKGRSYRTLMKHEHINRADEIEEIVRYFFKDVICRRFPLPAFHLSFYSYLEARGPRQDRAEAFLANRNGQ